MTCCNYLRLPVKGFVSIPNHTSFHWPCLGAFRQVVVSKKKIFNSYGGHRRIKWNLATMIGCLGRSWEKSSKPIKPFFFHLELSWPLKTNFFCKLTFSLLENKSPSKFSDDWLIGRKLRSVLASWRPAAHVLLNFLHMIGYFVRPQT